MECELEINGFAVRAAYDDAAVEGLFRPFLRRLAALQRAKQGRAVAFIAAPPATGKSTLAAFLQRLAQTMPDIPPVQALGMDGFHYPQREILARTVTRVGAVYPMRRFKGAPDTFDAARLRERLHALYQNETLLWPFYDRRLHDVVEDAVRVTAPIVIVEGNYLLLDQPEWRGLPHDYAVFIEAEEALLRARLIARKMQGGLDADAARAFYEECDGPNVRLCLNRRLRADCTLHMLGDGRFERVDEDAL